MIVNETECQEAMTRLQADRKRAVRCEIRS